MIRLALALLFATPVAAAPLQVRVVVVTAFEIGADTGDTAGELQAWANAYPATLSFPAGERPLRVDAKTGVLVVLTGVGTARAVSAIMALGLDPRFDLTRAYWLIAAIAGVNPNAGSIGSAAWIGRLVDTDLGYEIDAREIPADWPNGRVALSMTRPGALPLPDTSGNLFVLDMGLRDWAYRLTKDVALDDTPALRTLRARYVAYPAAGGPPAVFTGDEATGQTFWHGKLLNDWAEGWTRYWTGGQGRFVMTGMEDTGVARALDTLGRLGRADAKRLLVLRTGSNYSVPPPGTTAAASLAAESGGLTGLQASLDAAYRVGRTVVDTLTGDWPRYGAAIPR